MNIDQINSDVSAQIDLYSKLLRLCEIQHTLIAQERTDDLIVVLQRRQMIVEAVGAIEQRLKPIKQDWHSLASGIDRDTRSDLESKFAQSRDLLMQITQADDDDALMLQQRKMAVGRQLRQTTSGRVMNQKYAAGAYATTGGRMDVSR
jgi:hypothetical protein